MAFVIASWTTRNAASSTPPRQRPAHALDGQRHRQTRRTRPFDEPVEAVERRRRRGLDVQHPEQALELDERLAAGVGDQLGGLLCALRLACEDPPGAARLHDHDAHRVRDDVVHLACDPLALLDHRPLGLRGAALVGPCRGLVQLAGQAGTAAGRAAREAEGSREDGREGDVADGERAADRAGGDDPADQQAEAGSRAADVLVCAEAEGQRQQREPHRREVAGRRQRLGRQRDHQQAGRGPQRPRAPPGERQHDARGGDDVGRRRAAQVGGDRELRDGHRQREAGERPVEPRRSPHVALPSGRRARRAWPPSRAVVVRSSPPYRATRSAMPIGAGRADPSSTTSRSTASGP
jgi:hypothetical protein